MGHNRATVSATPLGVDTADSLRRMPPDEEEIALEAVLSRLRAEGHVPTVLNRPDLEERTERAVDFEIDFDGAFVAVEITSASGRCVG